MVVDRLETYFVFAACKWSSWNLDLVWVIHATPRPRGLSVLPVLKIFCLYLDGVCLDMFDSL